MSCGWKKQYICFIGIFLISFVAVESFCASDKINKEFVGNVVVDRIQKRPRRETRQLYEPLRITLSYHNLDEELNLIQQGKLKLGINKAVLKAQKIFSGWYLKKYIVLPSSLPHTNPTFPAKDGNRIE